MAESILDWYIKNALALAFDSVDIEAAPIDSVANDDAWITVHPNESSGRHVLLDDDGYIKAGMGGTFKGQRIDLIPRKGNKKPSGNEPIKPAQQRYKLKPPTKPSNAAPPKSKPSPKQAPKKPAEGKEAEKPPAKVSMAEQPRGVSDEKEQTVKNTFRLMNEQGKQEIAASFKGSPGNLIQAIANHGTETTYKTLTGTYAKAAWCSGQMVCIGDKHKEFRDKLANGTNGSAPAFREVNSSVGTLRHETGHALDKQIARLYQDKNGNPERKLATAEENKYASSCSQEFCRAVFDTEKSLYQSQQGVKQLNDNIVKEFGLKYGVVTHTYSPVYGAKGPTLAKCAPLSDILGALTGGFAEGHWGHSSDYWDKGQHTRRTEIFANLTSLYGAPDDTGWKAAERVFPELTKAYVSMIEKAAKSK